MYRTGKLQTRSHLQVCLELESLNVTLNVANASEAMSNVDISTYLKKS